MTRSQPPVGTKIRTGKLLISVLGPFELRRDDRPVLRLPKKAQAMLAILAIGGDRPVPRDYLATLLWGDHSTEQARQSLRQSLLSLRNVLGPDADRVLLADMSTVALAETGAIWLDAREFETLSRSGDLVDLARAEALYRDDLLSGLHIPVEPFERWLTIERQRLAGVRLILMERLATAQARAGQIENAIASARHMVALDPFREEAHRLVMRLLTDAGNRGAALVHYDQCARVLREELGIEPDAETTRLAAAIRDGTAVKDVSGAAATAPPAIAALALPDKPSIAVLPFANLSSDGTQDYFIQGLVDDITVALGREKWLFVIASPSAIAAGDDTADPRQISTRLGVRYVLRGSVRLDAGQVLVVAQLSDAARGVHVWSERFQDQMDNLFALQERLTTKVAAMIAPALMAVEVERASHKGAESLTAFDLYLRALPKFRISMRDNEEALALLSKAIDLNPSYASAYGMMARCYQFQLMFGWRPPGDPRLAEGKRYGHEAAQRGRNDSEALWMSSLALVHLSGEHDFCQALLERSLHLNPNSANAWTASCLLNSYLGNTEIAIDHFERAQRLNPLDLSQHLNWNILAWAYLGAGRYEEAAAAAEKTRRIQPDFIPGLRLGAVTAGLLGRVDEARAHAARMLAKQPNTTISWMRAFLEVPLQRNKNAIEKYLEGARIAGVPEGA